MGYRSNSVPTQASPHYGSKLRFVSIPTKKVLSLAQSKIVKRSVAQQQMRALRAGILRRALRRRRAERAFGELKKVVFQRRRAPKEFPTNH
jgi:hypothetical protein